MPQSLKIIFFGAPYFSREILKYLLENNVSIETVITHPDQPIGRKKILTPTATKLIAQENNISIKEFHRLDTSAVETIKNLNPDLFIVASYGAILPKELLVIPKFGALNVHPSLLPKLRGASPIQTALLNGLSETGTTIMLMDEGMDTGNIIVQKKLTIQPTETYPQLEQRLINLSNQLLVAVIQKITETNKRPRSDKQDDSKASYTKIIRKEDGLIDWNKSAEEIYNQWRAFYSWPQIYTFYQEQKLTLSEIELFPENDIINKHLTPGEILLTNNKELLINTAEGFIKVTKLQLAGKKKMSAKDFLNGQQDFTKTILTNK